jgi:dTDP-glucose 4,6-dehydratase
MRIEDGRALPAFMAQALRGEGLTIYGDGSQTRSFCYVDDLVEGIYRLLFSDYSLPVNIGNPDEITIMQLAKEIIQLVNNPAAYIDYRPLPEDDPKVRQPDITLAMRILGWEPKVARSEGLVHTLEYFRKALQKIWRVFFKK